MDEWFFGTKDLMRPCRRFYLSVFTMRYNRLGSSIGPVSRTQILSPVPPIGEPKGTQMLVVDSERYTGWYSTLVTEYQQISTSETLIERISGLGITTMLRYPEKY